MKIVRRYQRKRTRKTHLNSLNNQKKVYVEVEKENVDSRNYVKEEFSSKSIKKFYSTLSKFDENAQIKSEAKNSENIMENESVTSTAKHLSSNSSNDIKCLISKSLKSAIREIAYNSNFIDYDWNVNEIQYCLVKFFQHDSEGLVSYKVLYDQFYETFPFSMKMQISSFESRIIELKTKVLSLLHTKLE